MPRLALLDIRVGPLFSIYGWRLRRHGVQELLAGVGIAIGVALLFGVLVVSQSITGSASKALHDIIGNARLEVAARSPAGFDESLVEEIGRLPGVKVAAPVLRQDALISGPSGRRSVELLGVTASQLALEAVATRNLGSGAEVLSGGVGLPAGLAGQIGATTGAHVTLLARGAATTVPVRAVLGSQQIGSVASSPIAVVLLPLAQRALAEPHRVTEIFIEPDAGSDSRLEAALRLIAGGRLDVQTADHELTVLDASAQPTSQSSQLFAAIAAIVGFLFAVNAMLLTVPERRRWIADARTQGYSAGQITLILGFQAIVLGLIASGVGVLLGDVLAHRLFNAVPSYLTLAFPIGTRPVISLSIIALAIGAGVLATLAASALPLRDLLPGRPIDAVLHTIGKVGQSISGTATLASGIAGLTIIGLASVLALASTRLSIVSGVLLGVAVLCIVPALLVLVLRALLPFGERLRSSMLAIALIEVDGTATRSIALAGVAALAIYGSDAVAGSRSDLIRGLDGATVQQFETGDLWVTPTGESPYLTDSFQAAGLAEAILRSPDVASVRPYQSSFLDIGSRRLWIRARPPGDGTLIQAGQLLDGNLARATALIRSGGWAGVSSVFASERRLSVGGAFQLPTPAGSMPLRVAAITTNSGWPPGAITMNTVDYSRYWQSSDPTALEVNLRPGVGATAGRRAVEAELGTRPALTVQTRAERDAENERDARQGVQSLGEITTLMLIAAALAIASALSATISARRWDLSTRKADGYSGVELWRSLLLESAVVLGVGALDGTVCGIYGHALASRWLRLSQGFPAPFSPDAGGVLLTLGIVAAVALAVIAAVGSAAVRVPPSITVRD